MRARWSAFGGTIVAFAAASAWAAVAGPDPFPTHFGPSGHPITWEPRAEALIVHAVIAALIAAVAAGLALAIPRLPESVIRTPRRDYWLSPAHRRRFDDLVSGFILWTGGLVLLLRAATVGVTVIDPDETAAKSTLQILFVLAVVGSVGYLLWVLTHPPARSRDARRVGAGTGGNRSQQ